MIFNQQQERISSLQHNVFSVDSDNQSLSCLYSVQSPLHVLFRPTKEDSNIKSAEKDTHLLFKTTRISGKKVVQTENKART